MQHDGGSGGGGGQEGTNGGIFTAQRLPRKINMDGPTHMHSYLKSDSDRFLSPNERVVVVVVVKCGKAPSDR